MILLTVTVTKVVLKFFKAEATNTNLMYLEYHLMKNCISKNFIDIYIFCPVKDNLAGDSRWSSSHARIKAIVIKVFTNNHYAMHCTLF